MTPLHSRDEAGLRAPRATPPRINVEGLTAHYMGPSPWARADRSSGLAFRLSTDHARCPVIWRGVQAYHMDNNGWNDVAYSSAVCPHGHRYEGRGPGARTGANGTAEANSRSLATCYLAGDDDPITEEAKAAYHDEAARFGTRLRWDHSDWFNTSCAGDPIRSWEAAGWPAGSGVSEEDDMPLTQEDVDRVASRVRDFLANPQTNPGTVIDPGARGAISRVETGVLDPKVGVLARLGALGNLPAADVDEDAIAQAIVEAIGPVKAEVDVEAILRRAGEKLAG